MKPENHAIRQLEKQLDGASPEVAAQIERVIAALNTCLMNKGDPTASLMVQVALAEEVARLHRLMKPDEQP